MQDERVGRLIRAVRIRRGWRQLDLAALVGCSQRWIAQIELGRLDATTIGTMRKVGDALEIRVTIDAWWRAGDGAQLLDAVHAGIVERVMRDLVAAGWNAIPELSFNHYGERGSVDIVAWHAATRTLLIIEVKSRIDDDRTCYIRLVARSGSSRTWSLGNEAGHRAMSRPCSSPASRAQLA